jgi:hypothetical protein
MWHAVLDVGTAKCFKAVLVPAGCVGTICGVKLSPALSDFLNFPNLNLLMCGLVADCGNPAYIAGGGGQVNFTTSLLGTGVHTTVQLVGRSSTSQSPCAHCQC